MKFQRVFGSLQTAHCRTLCRPHMAVMERMGLKMQRFGDAETALTDLG